jgi:hypothetical protein
MKYCIQCTDQNTGQTGDFGYDPLQGNTAGSFRAITPIFPCLQEFYAWAHQNGVLLEH